MGEPADRRAFLVYRLGAGLLRALPRPVASDLAAALGRLGATLSPARRAVVAENLRHVVGEDLSPGELDRLVRRAFASYGRYWADGARLRAGQPDLLTKYWSVEGDAHLIEAARAGKGVVVALPHLGSWEIGGPWAASIGLPLTTVAEPAATPELFEWFVAERQAMGLRVLPLGGDTATQLVATLRAGGVVALLADRDVVGDGVEVPFFGAMTRLPAGPAVLALRTGAALLPCAVYHERGDHHHAVIGPPIDTARRGRLREDAVRVTEALTIELEVLIRRHPEQWHVFQPNWPHPERPANPGPTA